MKDQRSHLFQLAYAAVTKDMDIKDTLEAAKRAEKGVEGGELDKKEMMLDVVTPKVRREEKMHMCPKQRSSKFTNSPNFHRQWNRDCDEKW